MNDHCEEVEVSLSLLSFNKTVLMLKENRAVDRVQAGGDCFFQRCDSHHVMIGSNFDPLGI